MKVSGSHFRSQRNLDFDHQHVILHGVVVFMSDVGVGPLPCSSFKLGALIFVQICNCIEFYRGKIIISLKSKNKNVMNTIALTSSHIFYTIDFYFYFL